jgi:hypothetical protein
LSRPVRRGHASRGPLVVHAARRLPMDAERKERAVIALKALLIRYARDQLAATADRLDTAPPEEASSGPID